MKQIELPRVYVENLKARRALIGVVRASPRVRGKHFLTRLNAWSSREIHSLCTFSLTWDGLNIPV